jgi:hypothetical membrane protein
MRRIPWWALASAICAPVLLVGGWTLAASRQPPSYNAVRDTISALAGLGATDRWIMTVASAGLGICHFVTALGLRPAAMLGRCVFGVGGLATLLVTAFPLPRDGPSRVHGIVALVAFVALAIWPALAARPGVPWALRRRTGIGVTVVLLGILTWFGLSLLNRHLIGLSERCAGAAESVWPLVVVVTVRASARRHTERPRAEQLAPAYVRSVRLR